VILAVTLLAAAPALGAAPSPDPSPSGGGGSGAPGPDAYAPAAPAPARPAPTPTPSSEVSASPSRRVTAAVVHPTSVVTPETVRVTRSVKAKPPQPTRRAVVPPVARKATPKQTSVPRTLRDAIGVRIPFAPGSPDERARALTLAGAALAALAAASGGFLGLYRRYRRELGV